jgi:hypothetical protein
MQSLMNRGQEGSGASLTYEVGIVSKVPVPSGDLPANLASLAEEAFELAGERYATDELSSLFFYPRRPQNANRDAEIVGRLNEIQSEIDAIVAGIYHINAADLVEVNRWVNRSDVAREEEEEIEGEDVEGVADVGEETSLFSLLSWVVGVAFGRFDWELFTRERAPPPRPELLDPLPAKSPGMLLDGADPFHRHAGILVDDADHPHDLAHLVEEVLARVDAQVPPDVRRWLQRDFFPFHLQHYSKSRRRAPIYWPLSTASGSYTLWLYYPTLTSQTLYSAVNDFIEGPGGKLKRIEQEAAALRTKGSARTREEDKRLEGLQTFELEIVELRDTLLKIAPTYRPKHDDGIQISAAPLWPLFRHKPWQKVLKDTWAKLEKGDYDWAHLAMAYWPGRVREKCQTDKSLAIAHDLGHLYVEPEAEPAKARGRKKKTDE